MKKQKGERQSLTEQITDAEFFAGYKGGEEMPLASYAVLLGIYTVSYTHLTLPTTPYV